MSDLWVLAGQSNMEGCGKLINMETPSDNIRCFAHGDYWKVAEEPLHWLNEAVDTIHHMDLSGAELEAAAKQHRAERTQGTGSGLTFAKTISQRAGIDVDLLPAAHGGTSMSSWSPDLKHLKGGSLFGALIRRTELALSTGGDTKLRGILWYQGESDCDPASAALYTERMVRLIEEFRKDLSSPSLPFYFVQLGCWGAFQASNSPSFLSWNAVREAQRTLPELVPFTGVVPAIDLSLDDGIHISTAGQKRIGKRLANLALKNVYGLDAPTGPRLKSVRAENDWVRVTYENVEGKLTTPDLDGRISGFTVTFDQNPSEHWSGCELDEKPIRHWSAYRMLVDPKAPNEVILFFDTPIVAGAKLYYGAGPNPFCQLVDAADMAAPAFGPIEIQLP